MTARDDQSGRRASFLPTLLSGVAVGLTCAGLFEARLSEMKDTLRHELQLVIVERNTLVHALEMRVAAIEAKKP